jgi:hypothetical protein
MYRSALVRDKWEARGDYYLPRTIQRACGVSAEVAKGPKQAACPAGVARRGAAPVSACAATNEYMGVDGQLAISPVRVRAQRRQDLHPRRRFA